MIRAGRRFSGSRDYGEKLNYDPQWKGPLEIERKRTDVGFLLALGIYLIVWVGNGVYAFYTGDIRAMYKDFHLDYFFSIYTGVIYIALGFSILGVCLGFTYLFLLKYYAKAVIFSSFFFNLVFFITIVIIVVQVTIDEIPQYYKNYIIVVLIIITILVSLITAICLIVFYNKILIACEVIKESAKVVTFFPSSFLFLILPFIWYLLATIFTAYTWAFLYENSSTQNKNMPYHLYLLHGINFFGFFWIMTFIYAFTQMVLSGTFATWYWALDRNRIPSYIILKLMYITARFHSGTLAFGSLIVATIRGMKYLLRLATRRSVENEDHVSAICFSCFECMCHMTEEMLEIINTNAYIMCMMHGSNFIQSAKDAFNLIGRNILKFWAVGHVISTVIFSAEGVVIFLPVLATYAYCQNKDSTVMYIAIGIVFVTTTLISVAIFGVLETAVDTIFLCVMEDDERNDGSRERPYFMTPEMRQLLMRDAHGRHFDV